MTKITIEVKKLKEESQKAIIAAKKEAYKQIELLETQHQKHLLTTENEYLVEVTDTIVESLTKFAAINNDSTWCEPLRDKVEKFIDKIWRNLEEIEVALLSCDNSNDRTENEFSYVSNLQPWTGSLQDSINKIINIYEQPRQPNKNAPLDISEYNELQRTIEEEITGKMHFFRSIKSVEEEEINKHFDRKTQELIAELTKTSRQINIDLMKQIDELHLSSVNAEIANINLNACSSSVDTVNADIPAFPLHLVGIFNESHESI